jgi:hypothetical protein
MYFLISILSFAVAAFLVVTPTRSTGGDKPAVREKTCPETGRTCRDSLCARPAHCEKAKASVFAMDLMAQKKKTKPPMPQELKDLFGHSERSSA